MKTLPPTVVLISALLLQGCVAAVVVGTAAVGTKTVTDSCSVGTQVDDSTLEVRVNSALSRDEQIKEEICINVMAYQGKVPLVGQSSDAELSTRARQIAMGVDGANEVYNETRQGQPIGLGEASNDTWVATRVRLQLLTSGLVESPSVKVTTENGEMFLMGLATEREMKAAVDITNRVSGVKRATTAFMFIRQQSLVMPDTTLVASYQAYGDVNRGSDKASTSHPTCSSSNQGNSASSPTITPDTVTIVPVSHKAFVRNALHSIISDDKLTAESVINNTSARAVPISASIIVCTIGISIAVGMTNKHSAITIATTHIRLPLTAPSTWGNNQTRAAPNTSTART